MKQKNIKKGKNRLMVFMMLYALVMLIAVIVSLSISRSAHNDNIPTDISNVVIQTEYVYVNADNDTSDTNELDTYYEEQVYIVKEYMDIVGIFLPNGILYDTIDVYVKTLPEADRRLLGEGFEVFGDKALGEIIQDLGS